MRFVDFARVHGVEIDPSRLYASEKIKRCGTVEKSRSLNGAYFWDGERGWVMNWSAEAKVIWYEDPHAKPWTDEEKRAWAQKRSQAASDQEQAYEKAAAQAYVRLKSAKLEPHGYLQFKGFKDEKGLVLEGRLLVPMRNARTNALQGYQAIFWDGDARKYEKKMMPGMRARNAVLYLGSRGVEETWIVEGFATGLSLRHALRSVGLAASVVVAFSASNLVQVADQIPGRRFVFADHDESKTGEKAARETGLPWCMADETGWDANDLHTKTGLFSVVKKIMDCKRSVMTPIRGVCQTS
ncbi:hypothetical protein UFOVP239_36 [uncultured Caudovirales phage]|uniref:Toprim domain-containing protein n=1 Tax=uncultured Caudovirales phage TaxID=2100421 RepID=A0A6J7WTA4_9CAUD|nr:hypothetical protein UFOVP239_36 [uncultured Caudovirales phage]